MPKININKASKKELIQLKGIAGVTADKIIRFRKEGGKINTLSELKEVSGIRAQYLDQMKNYVDFGTVELVEPHIPDLILQPRIVTYNFTVQLSNVGTESDGNPYTGYKLVVGYKVASYIVFQSIQVKDHSKTYNIGADGKVAVRIPEPGGNFFAIQKTFDILIISPNGNTVYDSSLEIDKGDSVAITLPFFRNNFLLVALEKNQTINYSGYQLEVEYRLNRGRSGIDVFHKEFDIVTREEFPVSIDSFGQVVDVELKVLSPNGVVILRQQHEWDAVPQQEGQKYISLDLPMPEGLNYVVLLKVDTDELNNPYADHTLGILYDIKDGETETFIRKIERKFPIDATGTAYIDVEYYGIISEMNLQVQAPAGEVIGKKTIKLSEIGADGEVHIKVPPKKLAGVEGIETLPERPEKTTGRVIDFLGKKKYEDTQVVIYVATTEDPQEEDFHPFLVTRTEAEGYFVIDTPKNYYYGAYAVVGVELEEHQGIKVPIRLERDQVVVVKNNEPRVEEHLFFPANLILVVDPGNEEEDGDCGCNDCQSHDYDKPRKVLDEFSFYTVVRTTEPDIQGITLEEDGEITVQNVLDVVPVSRDDSESEEANIPTNYLQKSIRKNILNKYINSKKGISFTTLKKAIHESNALKLREKIKPKKDIRAVGRHALQLDTAIDWDEDPTIYQATSLAHGHLLHYRQEWIKDGYSLGDLLYSLPLAPGQKKQIVVFDWERRESAGRREQIDYQESLENNLTRDRDINEVVNGAMRESMLGGSSASTASVGGGFGLGFPGGLLGVAGGYSTASSNAWQNSSRNTSMNDLQQLRDKTLQSSNAVRSQRATVITTANQGESFSAETESVANYNHCHSVTIQYYEVLRHLKVQQRLSSVQECLFIPLLLSTFDYQKILRWRESLSFYIRSRSLRSGFDAIQRIENDYEGSDLPEGSFADEDIEYLEGEFYMKFNIPAPQDLELLEEKEEILDRLSFFLWVPGVQDAVDEIFRAEKKKRNDLFYSLIVPEVAAAFVQSLKCEAVMESGQDGSVSEQVLPMDPSLISRFSHNTYLNITLRQQGELPTMKRAAVKAITITKASEIIISNGERLSDLLPPHTSILIRSGRMRYRTGHSSGYLFNKNNIKDDLVGYGMSDDSEKVRIATPLSRHELRNPRKNDLELANTLQDHLNDNLEQYHSAIWMHMSSERRFMFLDGIRVTDYSDIENYPQGIIRSVASVVENRVIGVAGNSLIMPVAPGFRLDPNVRGKKMDLLSLYKPTTPLESMQVSIPTKGVFAEAVMGKCNSCEKKEEDRFWRWSEEPIPQDPTSIQPVSTDSRRSQPLDTQPTAFPNPMINIQNAPAAPNPQGFAATADLLKNSSFRDITGLQGNQANAIQAFKSTLDTASHFGNLASKLQTIKMAKENNMISEESSQKLTEDSLKAAANNDSDISSGLSNMKKVKQMMDNREIPIEPGNKILDNISRNIGIPGGGGTGNLEELVKSGEENIRNLKSLEARTTAPDGSSSEIKFEGNTTEPEYTYASYRPENGPNFMTEFYAEAAYALQLAESGVGMWTDDAKMLWFSRERSNLYRFKDEPISNIDQLPIPPWVDSQQVKKQIENVYNFLDGNISEEKKEMGYSRKPENLLGDWSKKPTAKYFVLHDTADSKDYGSASLASQTSDINEGTKNVHLWLGVTNLFLAQDWHLKGDATKLETGGNTCFVHVELTRAASNYSRRGNFSTGQYSTLAFAYIAVSLRAGRFLTITAHREVDRAIKEGHNDPENFDIDYLYELICQYLSIPSGYSFGIEKSRISKANTAGRYSEFIPFARGRVPMANQYGPLRTVGNSRPYDVEPTEPSRYGKVYERGGPFTCGGGAWPTEYVSKPDLPEVLKDPPTDNDYYI